jgi:hypothetical protein
VIETPIPNRNPTEQLTFLLRKGETITKISESPLASNGLPYCYVEVTETTGTHYVIRAYGQESATLYETAMKKNEKKQG